MKANVFSSLSSLLDKVEALYECKVQGEETRYSGKLENIATLSVWRTRQGRVRIDLQGLFNDASASFMSSSLYTMTEKKVKEMMKFLGKYLPQGRQAVTFNFFYMMGFGSVLFTRSNALAGEYQGERFFELERDEFSSIASAMRNIQ